MKKIVIFGNSGSGKTTLAKEICESEGLPHLDLDMLAWKLTEPPERRPILESKVQMDGFTDANKDWVIEGCYSDLLEIVIPKSNEIIFLNLPIAECIANARQRPWEPHKYESKEAQDTNLELLTDWISQYINRNDTFSKESHAALYRNYSGKKTMYTSNERR